ncbi:FecCD family ABC transporter permease [Petropleomorpha daqingensis]|uniref:Iron complex transport system permease protein n=1 Tax=Petropleomorpha daqingensis TaxID=2026353 RepID=A0A853CH20_9ACTN|nr:iron complex transport system permease protein [Petropleomorpha daqingensis]
MTLAVRRAVRVGPFSAVWRPRAVVVPLVLVVAVLLLLALNVGRGDFPISVPDVLRALVGGGTPADRFIVLQLRLPRSLTGVLVGLAFGMSGAILQSLARNPLASPDILGITFGASAAAVATVVLGGGAIAGLLGALGTPLAALLGGLLSAAVVYALAWRQGFSGFRLVLIGVAMAAVLSSLTSYLLIVGDLNEAARAAVWLVGSLNGRDWEHVVPVGLVVAVAAVLCLVGSASLRALRLGEDSARSLGVRLQTAQSAQLALAVALASVAVAAAGPVPFVALIAPQIAMRLVRSAGPPLLAGGLVGAVLVVGADVVSRSLLPAELPVGVVTAAVGAPYLIYLLARGTRRTST